MLFSFAILFILCLFKVKVSVRVELLDLYCAGIRFLLISMFYFLLIMQYEFFSNFVHLQTETKYKM